MLIFPYVSVASETTNSAVLPVAHPGIVRRVGYFVLDTARMVAADAAFRRKVVREFSGPWPTSLVTTRYIDTGRERAYIQYIYPS